MIPQDPDEVRAAVEEQICAGVYDIYKMCVAPRLRWVPLGQIRDAIDEIEKEARPRGSAACTKGA